MSGRSRTTTLLGAIAGARRRVSSAVADCTREWDAQPTAKAWSVRLVAEHVVQNDYFFANELARILGLPAPSARARPLASPGAAVDALATAEQDTRPVLEAVSDAHLALDWQDRMALGDLLAFYAEHTLEHLEQIHATRRALAPAAA